MPYIGQRPATGEHNSFKILDDISNYTLTFGSSDIDTSADTIAAREHRFVTGQRVTYGNGGGTDPTGLSNGTVYYIIVEDRHSFKLAANASDAASGSAINISTQGSGASHTINVAFDGVNTKFKATHTNGTKADITQSGQLMVSVNGVLQQPHDNTTTPTTGYATDHTSTIIFSAAPATNDQFFGRLIASNFATFDISDNTVDNFTGDGNTSTFTLSKTPPNNESVLVTIDGVVQYPDDNSAVRAYTVSENVIDFASAPGNGVEIQVRHIGFAGASTGGISGFYGRTGNAVLKNTDDIVFRNANVGVVTATDIRVTGNFTVDGTTTTLDTDLIGVDRIEVDANSTNPAVAVTQSGSGAAATFEGGSVGIGTDAPQAPLHLFGSSDILLEVESTDRYSHIDLTDNSSTARITNDGGTGTLRLRADKDNAVNNSNIQFEIDGSEKVRIKSDGNVGIGTDNPTELLHLEADSAHKILLKRSGASPSEVLFGNEGNYAVISNNTNGIDLRTGSTPSSSMHIDQNGRVGIGTDDPEDDLHIFLDSSSDGPSLRLTNPNGGDGTYTGRISTGDAAGTFFAGINFLKHDTNDGEIRLRTKVNGSNTDVVTIVDGNVGVGLVNPTQKLTIAGNTQVENATFKVVAASPNIILSVPGGGIDSRIYNDGSGNFNIGHGANSDAPPAKLSITTAGNVGIASTTPSHRLEVAYNDDSDGFVINNINRGGKFRFSTSGSNGENLDVQRYDSANNTFRRYLIFGTNQFSVYTGSTTSATERLRINSNGSVGIGTNNPDDRLHILGGNIQIGKTEDSGYETLITNNALIFNRNAASYIDQAGTGDIRFRYGANDETWMHMEGSNGRIGIGTDVPTSDLHVFRSTSASSIVDAAAGDALLTLRNAGDGNWSGINFTRERNTGTNVTGGSIWMPSDTSNNSATLYLQTQSASANAGADGALTDNNGVRLKLASQPGGNGGNSAFTVEVGSTEKFRVSSGGTVGIGSVSPQSLLTVHDSTSANDTPEVRIESFRPTIRFADRSGVSQVDSEIVGDNGLKFRISEEVDNDTALTERLRIESDGDIKFGNQTASVANNSTALVHLDAGREYWSGTAGDYRALKHRLYYVNTEDAYGLGVSASLLEIQSQAAIGFFAGSAGVASGRRVQRLRITNNGNIVTQGLTDKSFSNDGNAKILEITGDGTIDDYGVLNLSGNRNQGLPAGTIKFINRENSNSSSASNANSRQIASIDAYVKTSDSNAGDDSGGFIRFVTKEEAGGNAERFRIEAAGINIPTAGKMVFGDTGATGSPGSGGFTAYTHADRTTTALSNTYRYIYRLTTTGTGTDTGACYVVWYYKGNSTWQATLVSREGSNSNHPLLRINGSTVEIYTNHASSYAIRYTCERYEAGDDDARPHSLGPNFQWSRDSDDLYYNPGPWSSEKFRIHGTGQITTNGVRNIYETFRLYNNQNYNWDYTVPDEGGYGNSFYLVAGYNHYYTTNYGAHRTVWFSARGTSVNSMGNGIEQFHSQSGSWTFSKPNSTTVRITKTAGTYGGQGYGFIHLMYNHF